MTSREIIEGLRVGDPAAAEAFAREMATAILAPFAREGWVLDPAEEQFLIDFINHGDVKCEVVHHLGRLGVRLRAAESLAPLVVGAILDRLNNRGVTLRDFVSTRHAQVAPHVDPALVGAASVGF